MAPQPSTITLAETPNIFELKVCRTATRWFKGRLLATATIERTDAVTQRRAAYGTIFYAVLMTVL